MSRVHPHKRYIAKEIICKVCKRWTLCNEEGIIYNHGPSPKTFVFNTCEGTGLRGIGKIRIMKIETCISEIIK